MSSHTRTPLLALAAGLLVVGVWNVPDTALGQPGAGATATSGATGAAALPVDRAGALAGTLPDGSVAVVGGHGDAWFALTSAAVRGQSGTWSPLATGSSHDIGAVARMLDGSLLVAGGAYDFGGGPGFPGVDRIGTDGASSAIAYMHHGRSACAAATLPDGRVLVVGGRDAASAEHGELYSALANSWADTQGLRTPRAAPIVVPCVGGAAVVFSGTAPGGGATLTSVEALSPDDLSFMITQSDLIMSDPGWLPVLGTDLRRPVDDQRMYDGRYVFLAHRPGPSGETWALFTVDPATRKFALVPTGDPLPGDRNYESPLIDPMGRVAYLTAHDASDNAQVQIVAVDLADGTVTVPEGWMSAPNDQTLDSAGRVMLPDGRMLFAGGLHASAPDDRETSDAVTILDPDVKAQVAAPETPQGLAVRAAGAPALLVTWQDVSTWETGFRVDRRTPGGQWEVLGNAPRDATTWTDNTVQCGTSYEYHVCSFNPAGASSFTPDVLAKAPAGKAKTAARLNFGRIRTGMTKVKKLTIRNLDRRAELGLVVAAVEGPFEVSVAEPVVLAKKRKTVLKVTFRAPGEATSSGKLVLTTSDPKHPTLEVKLTGRSK